VSLAIFGCWIACFIFALLFMPDSYSQVRKWAMGFFGGLFSAICIIAGHLFNQQEEPSQS